MANHIMAHISRIKERTDGRVNQPITVILPYGGGIPLIEHHREEEIMPFVSDPGLVIAAPSTVQEFYDLVWASAASNKPVLLFIPKLLYRALEAKGDLLRGIPKTTIENFGCRVAKEATVWKRGRVTVATFGKMIYTALDSAKQAEELGIPVEVVAIRTLKPLDTNTLFESVEKTKRLVTVEEAPAEWGYGQHLIAKLTRDTKMLATIWATPIAVGAPETHHPEAPFWQSYIPQPSNILSAIEKSYSDESF